jgi:membrane-associated phospholipid phosphatase
MSSLTNFVSFYTDLGQVALPAVAGLYSLYKKDYKGVAWLLASVAVNQLGIEFLKRAFNTRRPNGGKRAFPSGNTAAAFLGPCFLRARSGLSVKEPLVFSSIILATLVGIGRVWINVHWPQDIVGGAFLGYAVTWLVPSLY